MRFISLAPTQPELSLLAANKMGYAIRQTTTGKVMTYNSVRPWAFYDPAVGHNPHIFADVGHAKAAITRAITAANNYWHGEQKEELREFCLSLEVVEVAENYSVTYGKVVFSQLFRADKT